MADKITLTTLLVPPDDKWHEPELSERAWIQNTNHPILFGSKRKDDPNQLHNHGFVAITHGNHTIYRKVAAGGHTGVDKYTVGLSYLNLSYLGCDVKGGDQVEVRKASPLLFLLNGPHIEKRYAVWASVGSAIFGWLLGVLF